MKFLQSGAAAAALVFIGAGAAWAQNLNIGAGIGADSGATIGAEAGVSAGGMGLGVEAQPPAAAAEGGVGATAGGATPGAAELALSSVPAAKVKAGATLTGANGVVLGTVQKVQADANGNVASAEVKSAAGVDTKIVSAANLRFRNGALASNYTSASFGALANVTASQ